MSFLFILRRIKSEKMASFNRLDVFQRPTFCIPLLHFIIIIIIIALAFVSYPLPFLVSPPGCRGNVMRYMLSHSVNVSTDRWAERGMFTNRLTDPASLPCPQAGQVAKGNSIIEIVLGVRGVFCLDELCGTLFASCFFLRSDYPWRERPSRHLWLRQPWGFQGGQRANRDKSIPFHTVQIHGQSSLITTSNQHEIVSPTKAFY